MDAGFAAIASGSTEVGQREGTLASVASCDRRLL